MPQITSVESRLVHRGRVFDVYRDRAVVDDGTPIEMDVIRHPGATAIVPFTADGSLVLIRQYRYALNREIWEIPAGTLEAGETPMICARRELEEEAGVTARIWTPLGVVTPLPGYADEVIHLFMAEGLSPSRQDLDPDEFVSVHTVPWETAMDMVYQGVVQDAKTVAGLFMAQMAIERKKPG